MKKAAPNYRSGFFMSSHFVPAPEGCLAIIHRQFILAFDRRVVIHHIHKWFQRVEFRALALGLPSRIHQYTIGARIVSIGSIANHQRNSTRILEFEACRRFYRIGHGYCLFLFCITTSLRYGCTFSFCIPTS